MIDTVIDFETYYSDTYSLTKMLPVEYIMGDEFKAHGASIKVGDGKTHWVTGSNLTTAFNALPWDDMRLICHNTVFDGAILAWRYGHRPKQYVDTMGLSRFLLGQTLKSHSLGAVYEAVSGNTGKLKSGALSNVKGVRDPSPAQLEQLGSYAIDDADQTWAIFNRLFPLFPEQERQRLDWTVRMFVDPKLMLDTTVLDELEASEIEEKDKLIKDTGVTKTKLNSNPQFAELLRAEGVEPPTKTSPRTGVETFDFSKQNQSFMDLREHENPRVSKLVEARLRVKSSIQETRARTLKRTANVMGGRMPVSLQYAGAMQTARLSAGAGKMNQQNLGRGSRLREAIYAPPGHELVVADLSNIELRTNMTMCRQEDAIAALRKGEDLYCKFATMLYGKPITKSDPAERLIGKIAELSLGYGASWRAFKRMLFVMAGRNDTEEFCEWVVSTYRAAHPQVQAAWRRCGDALKDMERGLTPPPPVDGPFRFAKDGVYLPSGFKIKYPKLETRRVTDPDAMFPTETTFIRRGKMYPSGRDRIYGAKVIENLNQGVAQEVLSEMQMRIYHRTGYMPVMQVHDEFIFVAPVSESGILLEQALEEMHKPPVWWPELPVAAEGLTAERYSDAK